MRVLVTSGSTWVAIDDTRVITNHSTGVMGRLIAEQFKKAGAKVSCLQGPMSFDQFAKEFKALCSKKFDIVIHSAAVSDFKPKKRAITKLDSGKALILKLVPTEKLINIVKRLSPDTFLVGFKLESSLSTAVKSVNGLFSESGCDLVVANSISNGYQACIIDADRNVIVKATSKNRIAQSLVRLLK